MKISSVFAQGAKGVGEKLLYKKSAVPVMSRYGGKRPQVMRKTAAKASRRNALLRPGRLLWRAAATRRCQNKFL